MFLKGHRSGRNVNCGIFTLIYFAGLYACFVYLLNHCVFIIDLAIVYFSFLYLFINLYAVMSLFILVCGEATLALGSMLACPDDLFMRARGRV